MLNEKSRLLLGSFQTKEDVIFRIPLLPFRNTKAIQHLNVEIIGPAIYSSSINLYRKHIAASVARKSETTTLFPSIVRYHLRMCTRPTPFGFFAGCGVTEWSDRIQINTQQIQPHTRLDHLVLHRLVQQLLSHPDIQSQLRYFPNNSLYALHDELRYVEYTLSEQKRDYRISAVVASESLENVLAYCQPGARLEGIAQMLTKQYAVSAEEAGEYLRELLTSQLLVSELEPAITGREYLPRVIGFLSDHLRRNDGHDEVRQALALLENIANRLDQIKEGSTTVMEQGPRIVTLLQPWLPDLTEHRLFQVDTIFPTIKDTSDHSNTTTPETPQIEKQTGAWVPPPEGQGAVQALTVLNQLTPKTPHPPLQQFATQFYQRYEEQEVPLAQALDTDTGVDYLQQAQPTLSPLLEELALPPSDQEGTVTWNQHQTWRWNLLQDALHRQQYTVEITDAMLQDFTASEDDLPPSMSVMFRHVEGERLYLDSVGGASATNLLNRFAHADPNIYRVVQDICDQEQQHNPEVIFVEIVHLPESRVGNIMFHPTSREYEIPYLAASAVDTDHQLPLSDLYVSVISGQVILRSQKLNKRIIPRLSTAHNHRLSELPVYRFLCDLQYQGLRTNLSFHWGALASRFKFLPRVMYQNIILHPATWQLEEADFAKLKAAKSPDHFQAAFQSFCEQHCLPHQWVLADGDNELFVDTEEPLIVEAWWDLARKRKQLTLKEFFAPAEGAVVNERGEAHAHQLVASWIKQQPTYTGLSKESPSHAAIVRSFSPGSEWLYYKLYGGLGTADRILEEVVQPLVEQLQQAYLIQQWFFLRYADPQPHLRLRFCLSDTQHVAGVMQQVREALLPFEQSGLVQRVQLDTYHRELERYGGEATTKAEQLFHYDSEATLQFLSLTEGDEREDLRWLWGLRSMDALLDDFQVALPDKLMLLESMKDSFAQEFKMDKPLKLQLDKKYREHRSTINDMLSLQDPTDTFFPLIEILQQRSARNASVISALREAQEQNSLPLPLTNLLRSYVHMLINRLMPSQARFHEVVLYDFLYREYRSEVAREKSKG